MTKKLNGYGLMSGKYLNYKFFAYRCDAVAYAKYQVSNHPGYDWHKCYKVVKVTLEVAEAAERGE